MSRSKRQSKRKTTTSRRKGISGVRTWLVVSLRRFGKVAALTIFVLWIGTWLWLSGSVYRAVDYTKMAFYDYTAAHGFAVQDIYIEGRTNVDADVLKAIINMERGDPILMFNPSAAKAMIDRISWVKDSHVERRLPNTIYVSLLERQPVALWQHQGKVKLIDHEGHVLTDTPSKQYKDMLIVVGDENATAQLDKILPLLAVEVTLKDKVDSLQFKGQRRWDMTMDNGVVVRLPEKDVAMALSRLSQSQQEHQILQRDLVSIDLLEPDRLVVRTRPGKIESFKTLINAKGDEKAI